MKNLILYASLLLILMLVSCRTDAGKSVNPLILHEAETKLYAIYKPAEWKVKEESQRDTLYIQTHSPDEASTVDFFWSGHRPGTSNVLLFLNAYRNHLSKKYSDVSFSDVYVSSNLSKAMATVRYLKGREPVKGRYFFEASIKGLSAQGYSAPETRLAADRALLLNIMASFAFIKTQPANNQQVNSNRSLPPFVQKPLILRQAQDRSLSLKVPSDWNFLAGGGRVISGSANGGMGFIFTSIAGNPMVRGASIAQGVISSPYQPPGQALGTILTAFGHRNYRIHSAKPDPSANQEFTAKVGRRCDAQDMIVSWTSNRGVACLGAFKVVNALPTTMGQWFCILAGIWGPEKEFYLYYPMLEQIGSSFSINDQYARQYIRAGLENLRRLQQKTMAAMQDLNRAREQNQTDWEARQARKDFMDSKWDDYRRGNSYWVSEIEGGKVYQSDSGGVKDTRTGRYYEGSGYNWTNFEGQNPVHSTENMREVSSYELGRLKP
jgi:hypothetical protein